MVKNPKTPYAKSFLWFIIDFIPIYDLFEPLKSLRPFKRAKMRYLGRIKAHQRTQKWLKTLKPPMPKVFWGLLLILYPYMTFLEPLKSLRPFKIAKMHYLGRI